MKFSSDFENWKANIVSLSGTAAILKDFADVLHDAGASVLEIGFLNLSPRISRDQGLGTKPHYLKGNLY